MYVCILALVIRHAKRTPLIAFSAVACQVIGYYIFPHYFDERHDLRGKNFYPLNPELNPICYLLALLGAHHFLHVSSIRVKLYVSPVYVAKVCHALYLEGSSL